MEIKLEYFTPLSWDSISNWKRDSETFIFNFNQNKKYKLLKLGDSAYCASNSGPYTSYFGCFNVNSMKSITHWPNDINRHYENGSEILPSKDICQTYESFETEVFKIIIE